MIEKISILRQEIKSENIDSTDQLEAFRLKYLSKKGLISQLFSEGSRATH